MLLFIRLYHLTHKVFFSIFLSFFPPSLPFFLPIYLLTYKFQQNMWHEISVCFVHYCFPNIKRSINTCRMMYGVKGCINLQTSVSFSVVFLLFHMCRSKAIDRRMHSLIHTGQFFHQAALLWLTPFDETQAWVSFRSLWKEPWRCD